MGFLDCCASAGFLTTAIVRGDAGRDHKGLPPSLGRQLRRAIPRNSQRIRLGREEVEEESDF